MEVCIRAWKYVSEQGSTHNIVEVCVMVWKYVSERESMCYGVKVYVTA